MNPAIDKKKKKKSQHFLGNQTKNFPKKLNTKINEQNQQPKYLKYNILGIQNFLKKSRFSIQTNTIKKLQLKLKTHSKTHKQFQQGTYQNPRIYKPSFPKPK